MKIIIQTPADGEEEGIIVSCRNLDPDLLKFLSAINMRSEILTAYTGDKIVRIHLTDVYYFEAVDKRTFVYCKKDVFDIKQKLYQIEEMFAYSDFLRISKSVIINISKIQTVYPMLSGRFEAQLDNGEKISISRQYVPALRKKISG